MAQIDPLFEKMLELGASDLHLTSGMPPLLRLDGDMVPIDGVGPFDAKALSSALLEIAPEANQRQFQTDGDTDFAYELPGRARFRANLFRDNTGPGGVFRVIPTEILTVDQLGLPESVLQFCNLSKGLVVVTGPTGSGKSTTLAAMIDHINQTRSDHIITIEDPIEFVHPNKRCLLNQREVGVHTQSFKRALRAALREDPDIVLVGEMRDLETVEIAMETAETGHLVFGTLHTTTAASTVDRIIDQFPEERQSQIRTMLGSSLKGVVAQTLCKKQPKGRVAAIEVLVVNNAVASMIREGKTYQIKNAMQTGSKLGMRLLNDSLSELVEKGLVTPDEAHMKAVDKDELLQKFARFGAQLGQAPQQPAAPAPAPQPAPAPELNTTPAGMGQSGGLRGVHNGEPAAPSTPSVPTGIPGANAAPPPPLPTADPYAQPNPAPAPAPQEPKPDAAPGGGGSFSGDPFEQFRRNRGS